MPGDHSSGTIAISCEAEICCGIPQEPRQMSVRDRGSPAKVCPGAAPRQIRRTVCRLEVGDTADLKSALRRVGPPELRRSRSAGFQPAVSRISNPPVLPAPRARKWRIPGPCLLDSAGAPAGGARCIWATEVEMASRTRAEATPRARMPPMIRTHNASASPNRRALLQEEDIFSSRRVGHPPDLTAELAHRVQSVIPHPTRDQFLDASYILR